MQQHSSNLRRFLAAVLTGFSVTAYIPAAVAQDAAVCLDDVVVVVSPDNPVSVLSRSQLIDIFLGRAVQFPDGRRAVPVDQSEGSAVRQVFTAELLGRSPAQIRSHWAKIIFTGRGRPPQDMPGCDHVKRRVASDPHAIGYIDRDAVDDSVAVVTIR